MQLVGLSVIGMMCKCGEFELSYHIPHQQELYDSVAHLSLGIIYHGLFQPWYMCTVAPWYTCTAAEIGCGIVYLGQKRTLYSVLRHCSTHYMCYIYVYRDTHIPRPKKAGITHASYDC